MPTYRIYVFERDGRFSAAEVFDAASDEDAAACAAGRGADRGYEVWSDVRLVARSPGRRDGPGGACPAAAPDERTTRAAYYRHQAALAERDASTAPQPDTAEAFRAIAAEWRRLALRTETA